MRHTCSPGFESRFVVAYLAACHFEDGPDPGILRGGGGVAITGSFMTPNVLIGHK